MVKKFIIVFSFCCLSLSASVINIAVAANVSYALNDLKSEFHKIYPDIKVQVTLGSSGKLTAQIKNGAPYELFMAANMKYPNALYAKGLATTKPVVYAKGSLAMLSTRSQDFAKGIAITTMPNIKKIAIANPNTAPYGKAAKEALKNASLYTLVKYKLVYAESVSGAVAYTVNATDLGFVAKSSLFSPRMKRFKKGVNWMEVDPKLYTPIKQGIVILKNAKNSRAIKAFYDFILSKKAKRIFKSYGYVL